MLLRIHEVDEIDVEHFRDMYLLASGTELVIKLDFPQSGDIAEGVRQAFDEDAGYFHHFRLRT